MPKLNMVEAVNSGLMNEMERDPSVFQIGAVPHPTHFPPLPVSEQMAHPRQITLRRLQSLLLQQTAQPLRQVLALAR